MHSHADQGLTGTKLGCGEGGCGACTVMVSSKGADGVVQNKAVNACLCPAYSVIGCSVTTVEGIGNNKDGLHPVQVSFSIQLNSGCCRTGPDLVCRGQVCVFMVVSWYIVLLFG
jgi:xanthine dehydrogenase/oxidase